MSFCSYVHWTDRHLNVFGRDSLNQGLSTCGPRKLFQPTKMSTGKDTVSDPKTSFSTQFLNYCHTLLFGSLNLSVVEKSLTHSFCLIFLWHLLLTQEPKVIEKTCLSPFTSPCLSLGETNMFLAVYSLE